jgi:hypothetical protein
MLDADVTDTGVAVARSTASGKYYAVQLFGRPESAGIEFVLENRTNETVTYAVDGERFVLEPRVIRTHRRCRAVDLVVHWPNGQPDSAASPSNGDRFAIGRPAVGRLSLERQ